MKYKTNLFSFQLSKLIIILIFCSLLSLSTDCKPQSGTTTINLNNLSHLLINSSVSTLSNSSVGALALAGGAGVTSVVKDIFGWLTAYSVGLGLMSNPNGGDPSPPNKDGGMTQDILRDIWVTISHYLGRHDLQTLENLENIALEILHGFTEREKSTVYFYLYNRNK